jgi:hypothetical protein
MCGTWTANVLKAGTTRRSFTFERKFGNLDTPEYHRFTGGEFNSMSLSISPDAIVTGSFNVIAQGMDAVATAIIAGATYSAVGTTIPYDSFSGAITEGGSSIGIVTAVEFTAENGLSPMFVIGSDETVQPGIRKSRISGTITAYFQSSALLTKFIASTASSMTFTLTSGASSILFNFPNILYNGGQPDVSDEGEITIALPFVALYHTASASQIVITRTP